MRRTLLAALAALLAAGLTACGAGGTGGPPAPGATAGFPVTVTGHFGTTTVPARPVRVVAMDWTDADFALALGVRPVGMARVPTLPSGMQPWTATAFGAHPPELFDSTTGDPLEQVAALRPDLILATKDYTLARDHAQLSRIAPVVGYVAGPNSDAWPLSFGTVATALGRAAQGKQITADTESWLAGLRASHPELAGKTFSYIVAPTPGGAYVVNSAADASSQALSQLGLVIKPSLLTLPVSAIPGRAQVSAENFSLLDAQLILAAGAKPALDAFAQNPVVSRLTAVRTGGFVPLDYPVAGALAFPSPLSLRWGISQILPRLSAAAHAD